ncbi:MAG: CHAT domain-containing protein [Chloroflexi bacterium]|nr:CHAT domain-containing protein [Chloroflexota bacterium]
MMKPLSPSVQALLDLWPELPHRVGAEWPSLYWRGLDLLRRYAALEDEERRAGVALEIARLLRTIPGGPEALRRFMLAGGERKARGEVEPLSAAELARQAEAEARLQALLHPPTVTRYTDIYAPTRVAVGERFPIIVGLTRSPADEEAAAIQAQLNQLIRVVLTPRGPELLSEPARTLRVEEGESEPVVFYLRAVRVGTQSVLIDFYSQSDLLVSATHTLTAEEAGVVSPPGKLPTQALRVGDYRAPYPDLVLRVCTRDNRLTYTLHYHNTEERIIEGDRLRADPEQYRYLLMHEIENLAKGLDADGYPLTDVPDQGPTPEHIFRGLEKIGWRLYNELFNEALRREYRERIRGKVHTLEIVSDEPWIPWELIKPFGDGVDDDFLCLQYDFSRWVSGGAAPAVEIAADSLACIAPTDSGLDWVQKEQAFVRALAGRYDLADRSPAEARRGLVEALLAGQEGVRLWHFACHGDYDRRSPDNSPLFLQDGYPLRPHDLVGPAQEHLRADRPLVFLNACRAGQSGLSLTGLGGWAKVLVQDCRVGALIAPLWSVDDAAAYTFAQTFYQATQQPGMTLAAALRLARQATRQAHPGDPTCLAYSLYAHPNARLVWGAAER